MKCRVQSPRQRGGYTLTEMMMVQAVILVMVAASWPALRSPLGKSELLEAAREVRSELAKARLRAIQLGVVGEFRFQPGTGHYEFTVQSSPEDADAPEAAFGEGSFARNRDSSDPRNVPAEDAKQGTLPADVCFCAPGMSWSGDVRPGGADAEFTSDAHDWSQPIYFFPNGRTSDARIRLRGLRETYVDITLRGLTGSATIGETRREDETSRDFDET